MVYKVPDDIHIRPIGYPLPRFRAQPPYVFFSRAALDQMLSKGNSQSRPGEIWAIRKFKLGPNPVY